MAQPANDASTTWGPYSASAQALAQRIERFEWFHAGADQAQVSAARNLTQALTKQFGVSDTPVRWVSQSDLQKAVSEYDLMRDPLWDRLKGVPEQIRTWSEQTGRTGLFDYAINDVAGRVFHAAFDGAFAKFETAGPQVVSFAVCAAMFVCGLSVAWEFVRDAPGLDENSLLPAVGLFEAGYLPVGVVGGQFLLAQ